MNPAEENTYAMQQDQEILDGFIVEAWEIVEELEPLLIEFHQSSSSGGPVNEEILNTILRLFHSLKGSSSFLVLENLTMVTHHAESLLIRFRDGEFQLCSGHTDMLCKTCDFVRVILSSIEEKGNDEGFETEAAELVEQFSIACTLDALDEPLTIPAAEDQTLSPPSLNFKETLPEQEQIEDGIFEDRLDGFTTEMNQQFIQESTEQIEDVEQILLRLSKSSDKGENLANAFRAIHSFKGNCGFLGYTDLEKLSHKTETILQLMKEGKIEPEKETINVLLEIVDTLRSGVAGISEGRYDGVENCDLMLRFLDELTAKFPNTEEPRLLGDILIETGAATPETIQAALEVQEKPLGQILVEMGATKPEALENALARQEKQGTRKRMQRDIRVSLEKLDALNDLIGELVIAQSMVIHNPDLKGFDLENFEKAAHHLERITSELQDVAMGVRMVPVSGLFRKMIRLVHDVSAKCGKKVNLEIFGEETEIDKTVMELVSDPLVHIIRNAVDHGIEPANVRLSSGKEETGTIAIEAKHDGGEVWITIRDDGSGLNREKILEKAAERGLVQGDGIDMEDEEVFHLIFEPGFSTAELVTDVSGRGVGMDVVRKNIDMLKGRVDIRSIPGRGTMIILRIPLTLAIIDGMLVKIGDCLYIIPLLAVKETFKPRPQDIKVLPGGQEMVKLRNNMLPIIRFHEAYGQMPATEKTDEGILVNFEANGQSVCLFVDEVVGRQETVIKGLPRYVGNLKGVSGCTILGGGDVSLIIDVGGLLEKARNI